MNVISLFSGAGGSSCGYKLAGCKVLAANEFIDYQAKNYSLNNPDAVMYSCDVRILDPLKVLEEVGLKVGELDILDGSPPCTSFSLSGRGSDNWGKVKEYSGLEQRTDDLFYEYIRFLRVMQPKVFVAENVSGLTIGESVGMFKLFFQGMIDCGYRVKAKVLNSANYGVPQKRRRVFFIGVRNDLNKEPSFPKPKGKIVSLNEAFSDLVFTEEDRKETDISNLTIYKKLIELKMGETDEKRFNLTKCDPFKPAPTLTQSAKMLGLASICHWDNRKFTRMEARRITSFPDDYKLEGTYSNVIEACGRSVPPLMMKAIAENIRDNILNTGSTGGEY